MQMMMYTWNELPEQAVNVGSMAAHERHLDNKEATLTKSVNVQLVERPSRHQG